MTDLAPGEYSTVTNDGFSVSSNVETVEAITTNLASEAKPKDGETPDPAKEEADRVSKAASELGKKGGEAAAKARAAKADTEDPDEDEDEDDQPIVKPGAKPRSDPNARIAQVIRQRKEQQARADAAEARIRELEASRTAPKAPDAPKAAPARPDAPQDDSEPIEPDPAKFSNWEDLYKAQAKYTKDVARWSSQQAIREERKSQQAAAVQSHQQREIHTAIHGFGERISGVKPTDPEYASKYEAFMEDVHPALSDMTPSFRLPEGQMAGPMNVMADEIVTSEKAPELLRYLSDNPDNIQRIAALRTPREIQREMAKIEARLEAATADTGSKREVSKANPPFRSVKGSPHGVTPDGGDDSEDLGSHIRRENAREKRGTRAGARL